MPKQTNIENSTTEKLTTNTKGWLTYVPYIIAVAVLIAYGFFLSFLIGKVGTKELDWSRLVYLFSGVEAIVFAAAGFLFGREVNRKRADNAEEEKKRAEKQKEEAKEKVVEERKNALILATMAINSEKMTEATTTEDMALEGMASKPAPKASISEWARNIYPELKDL